MKEYSIGPLTGSLKPKFKRISIALGEDFNPEHGVDFFFDLNTLVSTLMTSQKFLLKLPFAEEDAVVMDMIESILSILHHWKIYSRNISDKRFFFLFNDFEICAMAEQPVMKSYLSPYTHKIGGEKYNQLRYFWNEAIKRIEIILKYVPQSYFIHCDRFDSYVIPQLMWNYDEKERHRVIVTGSPFFTNYIYMKNTHVIYSRYGKNGMNQLDDPLMIVQAISKIDEEVMGTFIKNKVFYNLLSSIIGNFDRGIIGLTQLGLSSFAIDLLRSIEKYEIPNNPSSIESVLPAVKPTFHAYLRQVYPLVDIESHAQLVTPSMLEKVKSTMIDLYDIDSLSKLQAGSLNLIDLL